MKDQVVLITGALAGIGRATALAAAGEGDKVVVCGRDTQTGTASLEAAAIGVRVYAVAPGRVETGMLDRFTGSQHRKAGLLASVPLRPASRPEGLADAILFLASDKASFVTGHTINVNGGRTAS